MDNEDFATQVGQAVVRAENGQATPEDYELLRHALLGMPPSNPVFMRVSSAIEKGEQAGRGGTDGGFGLPTMDFASGVGGAIEDKNPLDWTADRVFGEDQKGEPGGSIPFQAPGMMNPLFGLATSGGMGSLFGRNKPTMPEGMKPSPAEASDIQGSAGVGSNTQVPETSWTSAGRDVLARARMGGADAYSPIPGVEGVDIYDPIPEGYSFSDANAIGKERLASDPAAFASSYAEDMGAGQYAASFEDPVRAAMAMSESGMIGPGGTSMGNNLQGAIGVPLGNRLQSVEDFMDMYAEGGHDIRPDMIYEEMFNRADNTDLTKVKSPQTGLPMTTEEIIGYTNSSLLAAAPFMTLESQAYVSSILEYYGQEYLNYIGTRGNEMITYPQFLRDQGVDQLLRK